ncbi:ATP-binding protein [Streptomyces sp. NPDC059740]|uniref:ATP-binding protein n=1 Tax=Streptomyces sp. NPDC059740 TaxID=3346926 RepID=UPI00365E50F5
MSKIPEALPEIWAVVTTATTFALAGFQVRARRSAAALRAEKDAATAQAARGESYRAAVDSETRHLASTRLPALVKHLAHQHVTVPDLLNATLRSTEVERAHREVMDHLAGAVTAERERVDESAQAVMRGATTVIQAQSYQVQSKIVEMQERYEDPDVAADLLALDELNEQNLRRIQSTGVLCGAWPGLTRSDSHLGDIAVGAQARVRGHQRVRVSSRLTAPVAVVARAVEPVAVVLAELLANAVHHSHGSLSVDVSLHQAESGACIIVDDAGVGMHPEEVEFAQRVMAGDRAGLLTELGDPPRTGFATIGRLTRQYGFSVSVDKPAPYGGVRAVVFIPAHLLTLLDEEEFPVSAMAPLSHSVRPTGAPGLQDLTRPHQPAVPPQTAGPRAGGHTAAAAAPETNAPQPATPAASVDDLPRRRRRSPQPAQAATPSPAKPDRTPEDFAATWRAFQAGTASGRAAATEENREGNHR